MFDIKGFIALAVVVGSFGLVGVYVFQGKVPDVTVVGIAGTSLGVVLGFYFGHVNGTAAANLATAQTMLTLAQQRRAGDETVGPTTPLPTTMAGGLTSSSSSSPFGSSAGGAP